MLVLRLNFNGDLVGKLVNVAKVSVMAHRSGWNMFTT